MRHLSRLSIVAMLGLFAALGHQIGPARPDAAWTVATDWVQGNGSRVRMIGAELKSTGSDASLVAGIEIELEDGYKTYWRSPGDSGGIPPVFDWDQSKNLGKAQLLYPAPKRFDDPEGASAGYKKHVVFPIEVTAEGSAPVELVLGAFYGVCREICIPAEAELALTLAPGIAADPQIAASLEAAFAAVPRKLAEGALPSVDAMVVMKAGEAAELLIDARFDPAAAGMSVFAEAEDGSYVPLPEKSGDASGGLARFRAKLKPEEEKALKGKRLILTLVSDKGNAEVKKTLE